MTSQNITNNMDNESINCYELSDEKKTGATKLRIL